MCVCVYILQNKNIYVRAETNSWIFGIFVHYPIIQISGTVYQKFIKHTALLAVYVATYAILVGVCMHVFKVCFRKCTMVACMECRPPGRLGLNEGSGCQ